MTPSEKYVAELCGKSFLPFWSFSNPIGKKNKELCDVLVVCENNIIIISVKDISVSEHKDESVQYERWVKKAIYSSADQIYGAERYLESVDYVFSKDNKTKIKLPKKNGRIIHRIAIAFGRKENFPLPTGDFGKGFVHVFDEKSTFTVLYELDTITDFTNYLVAKEKFIANKCILIPTESDFLAFYLLTGLKIDVPADTIVTEEGLWEDYIRSEEYLEWRKEIKISYVWDRMILRLHDYHVLKETTEESRIQLEESVRQINLEPRINRIELGSVLDNAKEMKVSARMLKPLDGCIHTYVLIPLNDKNWDRKESELKLRCIVARVENPNTEKIIGISIGSNSNGESSFDICYLNIPELDEELIKHAKEIQDEFGYFKKPVVSQSKDFRK
jgi:hypothetical protein